MRTFFGNLFLGVGALAIICGGSVTRGNVDFAPMALFLGLLPGGIMIILGFRLLFSSSAKGKQKKSDSETADTDHERPEK